MPARRLIERRDAHQPVDARLGEEQPVGVVAVDGDGGALHAGLVAGLCFDHLTREAAALRPAEIHPQQHLRPVLRFGPAGAGVDRDDGVALVVLAAEHLADLGALHLPAQVDESRREVSGYVLALLGPLEQHGEIVGLAAQRLGEIEVLLQPAAPLQHALRGGLVVPEVRRGGLPLQLRHLGLDGGGVKDSSASQPRA